MVDAVLLHEVICYIPSYKGSGEVEDLMYFLKKNVDLHKEVEVSDARKIKIVAQKLTGNTSFFW
jgi:hypothetical protein